MFSADVAEAALAAVFEVVHAEVFGLEVGGDKGAVVDALVQLVYTLEIFVAAFSVLSKG